MKKNKGIRGLILISLVSMVPLIALAQSTANPIGGIVTFGTIISTITNSILRTLIAFFATAAMAVFFYGIVQYIWGVREGTAKKIEDGNKFMRWGMLALFVMFSVWGIVTYGQKILGIEGQNTILIPDVRIQTGGTRSPSSPSGLPSGGGSQTVYTCPDGVTKYYDQSDRKFCPGSGSTGGTGGGAGGQVTGSKKANGYSCSTHAECSSGFCDPTDDVCTAQGSGNKKGLGYSCSNHAECASGFCDPVDDTCTAQTNSGGSTGAGDWYSDENVYNNENLYSDENIYNNENLYSDENI